MAEVRKSLESAWEDIMSPVNGTPSGVVNPGKMGEFGNNPYGMREDGTPKGLGFFGKIQNTANPDKVSTELSFDFDVDGQNILAPLMVPGLTKKELDWLLSGKQPTAEIYNKAQEFALQRLREGKSQWAAPDERHPVPTE